MLINCYYYAPHNHELLNRHLEWDLKKMKEIGCDALSVCVQESQLTNWHQGRLHNVVNKAHEYGLKVHAVPNRWAGITAGWIDGFDDKIFQSPYMLQRPDNGAPYLDISRDEVKADFMKNIKIMLLDFGFDGIIWDEPRPQQEDIIVFLDEMSEYAKSIKPDVVISMFAMASGLHLAPIVARTKYIDYLGSDGHVRSEDHQMHVMKNTIWKAYDAYNDLLLKAGKKTFYLMEAQRHRDADLDDYLEIIDKAFNLPMDHFMFYYSAHELSVEYEDIFNNATWNAVKKLSKKRDEEAVRKKELVCS